MNPETRKDPRHHNGPPKVVDQTPQESLRDLLPPAAGRQGLSKSPLEDRSDRLGDPPPTIFPVGGNSVASDAGRGSGPVRDSTPWPG